ncbi:MAG: CHAP domain-containing protein [Rhizomicrobium sp.]
MQGSAVRFAAVAMSVLGMAGCAGAPDGIYEAGNAILSTPSTRGTRIESPATPLECVPYARARSGVQLFGDAGSWWANAEGRYARGPIPLLGSVIVLTGYAGPGRGHLGVVSGLLSAREIRLDHANWLGDGAIYLGDPVVDVSPDNDWSEVRVWNPRQRSWGLRTYLVEGFVGPSPVSRSTHIAAE